MKKTNTEKSSVVEDKRETTGSVFFGIDPGSDEGDKTVMRCPCGWTGEISEMKQSIDSASKYYECPKCKQKYD